MTVERKALIIIPTYNERDNLEPLLERIWDVTPAMDVLVVDDASPDGTGEAAEAVAARDGRLKVRHRPGKLGLGTAYVQGFQYALASGYDLIFEMDADFSHDPMRLPAFLRQSERADLVLGSRWVSGGGIEGWPLKRQVLSRGGSLYARTILGLPYRDLTSGFKCFRRQVLEAIDLETIRSTGYAFQIELTYRAHIKGFRIAEIPIIFRERESGVSKMSGAIFREAVIMVWKLRLGLV